MKNNRARERFALDLKATAYELDAFGSVVQVIDGKVKDLSQRGIGLVLNGMVHLNRRLVIEAHFTPQPKWFFAEIVRANYEAGVGHTVGARLLPFPETGPVALAIARLRTQTA